MPVLAWADPKTPDEWYKEGENHFLLGAFDKAIEAFKQGFSLETDEGKRAVYLYNIAQSYRHAHDCEHALFFYKRFIALKDNNVGKPITPKTRKDVMDWIAELDKCVEKQKDLSKKPPTTSVSPEADKNSDDRTDKSATDGGQKEPARGTQSVASTEGGPGSDEDDRGEPETPTPMGAGPRVLSARLNFGGSKVSAGKFKVPVQATFALVGGYPIPVNDRLTVEAGVGFTFTPVPYDRAPGMSDTAYLASVMANGAVSYTVAPKVVVRGDLGLGGLFFSNVSESPFTNNAMTSGALSMFHMRFAVSGDYAFTRNIVGTLTPFAFTFSPPKKGLEDSIKRITSIDFMVGIGYRM